jgi:hypothetical protein
MRFGFRTPSIKRSFKARTTGYLKRTARRAVDPFYGTPGIGLIKDPGRAAYNKVYRGATYGVSDFFKTTGKAGGATTATGAVSSPDAAQTATFYADAAPTEAMPAPKRRHPFRTAFLITLAVIIFGGGGAAIALGLVTALGLIPAILVLGLLSFLFGGKH